MTLRKTPLLLKIIIAIALGTGCGMVAPEWVIKGMNTFNALFDQFLKFLIPLIIIGLVTPAIAEMGRGAKRMLLWTVFLAYGATVLAGLFSYCGSVTIFPRLLHPGLYAAAQKGTEFLPYFTVEIPPVTPVMTALVMSLLLGLGIASFGAKGLARGFEELKQVVTMAISKVIIPLLPPYIFGLFQDITARGEIAVTLLSFARVIGVIFLFTIVWMLLLYTLAGLIIRRNPLRLLWTMAPAYATALGTSSSAATIPVTLRQTLRNGVSESVAGFVIPLCATIHLSGSTLKITSCAIAIMLMESVPFSFTMMLGFILMLGITMVAAPGVPGGAIMAALGILGSMLGFSTEQQALMITLYIAMDSFGTACNVTGDGALALIIDRFKSSPRKETQD